MRAASACAAGPSARASPRRRAPRAGRRCDGAGGEAGGEREAAGVERREPLHVPGEAGRGGAVGGALGDGGEPLQRREGRTGAGRLGGGGHGELGGAALALLRAVEDQVAGEDEDEPHAEADRGRPREQAVGGGGRRGLLRAGHGRGRYPRRAAHSLRARGHLRGIRREF